MAKMLFAMTWVQFSVTVVKTLKSNILWVEKIRVTRMYLVISIVLQPWAEFLNTAKLILWNKCGSLNNTMRNYIMEIVHTWAHAEKNQGRGQNISEIYVIFYCKAWTLIKWWIWKKNRLIFYAVTQIEKIGWNIPGTGK